jgi:acyl-CoA-binding protein
MNLEEEFNKAVNHTKALSQRPSNQVLLKLYALYKQATMGDNQAQKPVELDIKALAKFNAWEALKGKSRETSMQEYIDLVRSLD